MNQVRWLISEFERLERDRVDMVSSAFFRLNIFFGTVKSTEYTS